MAATRRLDHVTRIHRATFCHNTTLTGTADGGDRPLQAGNTRTGSDVCHLGPLRDPVRVRSAIGAADAGVEIGATNADGGSRGGQFGGLRRTLGDETSHHAHPSLEQAGHHAVGLVWLPVHIVFEAHGSVWAQSHACAVRHLHDGKAVGAYRHGVAGLDRHALAQCTWAFAAGLRHTNSLGEFHFAGRCGQHQAGRG